MKAALLVLMPLAAHAEPAELGTPLPGPSAAPALAMLTPYVMSLDVIDTAVPAVGMSPRHDATLAGFSERSYVASTGSGTFGFYSLGVDLAFATGTRALSLELPSPGIGTRARTWLVSAQLVPAISWFVERGDRDHFYALSTDLQACLQYNFLGFFPKNSAACVYAAPAIYRDGWLSGVAFGLRWFPL